LISRSVARSFVVGTHMATTLAELVLNGVWYWCVRACLLVHRCATALPASHAFIPNRRCRYSGQLTPQQLGSLQYFFTALAVIVFLVELRVRKNEVLRALRRLVGSVDKYYIRYMCVLVYRPLDTLLCCHIHDFLFPSNL